MAIFNSYVKLPEGRSQAHTEILPGFMNESQPAAAESEVRPVDVSSFMWFPKMRAAQKMDGP